MPKKLKSSKSSSKKNSKSKNKKEVVEVVDLHPHTKKWILAITLFVLASISLLSLFSAAGAVGQGILKAMQLFLGIFDFLIPIILFMAGLLVVNEEKIHVKTINLLGVVFLVLGLTGLVNLFFSPEEIFEVIDAGGGGGYLGLILSYPFVNIMGFWASLIVLIAIIIIGLLLILNTSINDLAESKTIIGRLLSWVRTKWYDLRYGDLEAEDVEEEIAGGYEEDTESFDSGDVQEEEVVPATSFKTKAIQGLKKMAKEEPKEKVSLEKPKKVSFKKVDLPLDLLEESSGKATSGNILKTKEKIKKTFESFNIQVEMGDVNIGPTVTQYELIPAEGIKLSRITALQDDLALALAAHPLRMEAPIPGKSAVGVEIPNTSVAIVRLKELLSSKEFKTRSSHLQIPLGKDVSGQVWSTPLDKMPHLLVAGATGSGKSVCLNTIITSLLYQNGPEMLRFILVDPKKVELTAYENIPHLLTPVVTDVKKTVNALKWAVAEMERRYNLLQKMGKRNIISYNSVAEEKMPYIVFVIDEMADLMVAARNEVENLIIRLAQMARAVGIHLVLATQRPSVDVITGLIKANVPSRIAFAVASSMDSRTILDTVGAEKLVGKGDMLFVNPEHKKPVRIQGAFLSEEEVKRVVDYLKENSEAPEYNTEVTEKSSSNGGAIDFSDPSDGGDELFEQAKEVVIQGGKASTSYLQRRLKIGYSRAARIMDLLEEAGIVGPQDGSKPREILVTEQEVDEGFDVAENELQTDYENDNLEEIVEEQEEVIDENELEEEPDEDDEWLKS